MTLETAAKRVVNVRGAFLVEQNFLKIQVPDDTMRAPKELIISASDSIPRQDSNSSLPNKLERTFPCQIEALKRYQSRGERRAKSSLFPIICYPVCYPQIGCV